MLENWKGKGSCIDSKSRDNSGVTWGGSPKRPPTGSTTDLGFLSFFHNEEVFFFLTMSQFYLDASNNFEMYRYIYHNIQLSIPCYRNMLEININMYTRPLYRVY